MIRWHLPVRVSVVMLLVFVLGVGMLGVGNAYARLDFSREMSNTDGDPGEGSDSSGSGSGSSDYIPPPEDGFKVWNPHLPFFIWSYGIGSYFYFPDSQFFSIIVPPTVDFQQVGGQR